MESNNLPITETPPRIVPTLRDGFNTVTNHVHLVVLPVLLDLLIWLGPRLRVKTLLEPIIIDFYDNVAKLSTTEMNPFIDAGKELWATALDYLNLLTSLRTLPIGIPSLFAGGSELSTPFGNAEILELPNFAALLGGWLLLAIIGIALGSYYFSEIARFSKDEKTNFSLKNVLKQYLQIIIMTLIIFAIIAILAVPVSLFISIISLISPGLTQIAFVILFVIGLWLLLPLVFSAHGVFSYDYNIFVSTLNSIRLVRLFLPGTGLFILTMVLLNQGLNYLWVTPPQSSWLSLIGILGHAFISTALIASSFLYYQRGTSWMNENLKKIVENQTKQNSETV